MQFYRFERFSVDSRKRIKKGSAEANWSKSFWWQQRRINVDRALIFFKSFWY